MDFINQSFEILSQLVRKLAEGFWFGYCHFPCRTGFIWLKKGIEFYMWPLNQSATLCHQNTDMKRISCSAAQGLGRVVLIINKVGHKCLLSLSTALNVHREEQLKKNTPPVLHQEIGGYAETDCPVRRKGRNDHYGSSHEGNLPSTFVKLYQ